MAYHKVRNISHGIKTRGEYKMTNKQEIKALEKINKFHREQIRLRKYWIKKNELKIKLLN